MGYELLENDLTDSTLWMYRSLPAKVLAITILSKCNGSDRVYVPPAILIQRAGLSEEQGRKALKELMSPDLNSKCTLEGGRFVVEKLDADGNRYLWLPSYAGRRRKYLARERKRVQREREAIAGADMTDEPNVTERDQTQESPNYRAMSRDVTPSHDESQNVTRRAEAEQSRAEQIKTHPPSFPLAGGSREGGRVRRIRNRTIEKELRDRERAEKDLPREREIRKPFVGSNDPTKSDQAVRDALGYVPSHRLVELDASANLAPLDAESGDGPF